jgi:imidazolonepropionase-like amidohydrolase
MASALLAAALPVHAEDETSWTISADVVYTAAGDAIEGGLVTVTDGKISAVAKGGGGTLTAHAVTPGLIDLGPWLDGGSYAVEQSREVTPELRLTGSLDLFASELQRALRGGTTTVLANGPDQAVISGLGAVLKTGGEPTVEARLVRADAVMRGTIGSAPSRGNRPHASFFGPPNHFTRRPTTRMGVEWEWRKAFYDTLAAERDPARVFEGMEILRGVLGGEHTLFIRASTTQDIRTAIFLKREFDIPELVIADAAEAWKEPRMCAGSGASFVMPPYSFGGRGGPEGAFHSWDTAAELVAAGRPVALSSHGPSDPESRLSLQPGFAMRGGLSFDDALAAVTIVPARLVGVDDRVGSIEVGKDADLVLWAGKPFEPTSRITGVLIDGRLVVDPRQP